MDEKKTPFLPFYAINDFMFPEFRINVLQRVFNGLEKLSPARKSALSGMVKRFIKVPGFRNSAQAPAPLKAKASVQVFERNAEFTSQVLMAWCELQPELSSLVYEFLKTRGWELLSPEVDRTKLPGFLTRWNKDEPFEVLDNAFTELNPDHHTAENDIRLMIVWLSGRLPYEMVAQNQVDEEIVE
jgi:hypothetical protein